MPELDPADLPMSTDEPNRRVRTCLIGVGKMGISHLSLFRAHPNVEIVGVCDSSGYALGVLEKYTGVRTFSKVEKMLDAVGPEAVVIATPSSTHHDLARQALSRGIHVFCEKPFTLDPAHAEELTATATAGGLVTQVGYHNRFVGSFQETKRLIDAGAVGTVTHIVGEAYGPVVLEPKGGTWRSTKAAGGGCLYDYAAHVINLINWYAGSPIGVGGTVLNSVFSHEIDDEVSSTLYFAAGKTAQISANWCDESQRKMTTKVTVWGTAGRIYADRQEAQVYLRGTEPLPDGYEQGWNVRYATDLNDAPWFYLRGEEYSAQVDHFIRRIVTGEPAGENDFLSASATDTVLGLMVQDAASGPSEIPAYAPGAAASGRTRRTGRFWDYRRQLGTRVRRRLAPTR